MAICSNLDRASRSSTTRLEAVHPDSELGPRPPARLVAGERRSAGERGADGATKKIIRSLSERELDILAATVAGHLRLCRWQQLPRDPLVTGDQYPAGPWR